MKQIFKNKHHTSTPSKLTTLSDSDEPVDGKAFLYICMIEWVGVQLTCSPVTLLYIYCCYINYFDMLFSVTGPIDAQFIPKPLTMTPMSTTAAATTSTSEDCFQGCSCARK